LSAQNKLVYPFSALVGQDKMKLALILNVINPKIGGVLLQGEKGTGKSLSVRSLANLLPQVEAVADCRFNCDPNHTKDLCSICSAKVANGKTLPVTKRSVSVIDLPVGATEDRLVGTLDIEKAIEIGEKCFEPGILASANRNILYIDEVNLLDDHLVDVLLDAAAMGVNYVEREGISFIHPSQFVLVGTMNPEEGKLRPQLLDRFGLSVEVKGIPYREARAEIIRRRIAFEAEPEEFNAAYLESQNQLRVKIANATKLLPQVTLSDSMLELITTICTDFAVDGHRADIIIFKTACTIAAFRGRIEVTEDDVKEAAELALAHRRRRQPFDEPKNQQQKLQDSIDDWEQDKDKNQDNQNEEQQQPPPPKPQSPQNNSPNDDSSNPDENDKPQDGNSDQEQVFEIDTPYIVKSLSTPILDEIERSGSGRRSKSISNSKTGRYVYSMIPKGKVTDLAFDATIRAAAPFQCERKQNLGCPAAAIIIEKSDLREKVRERKVGSLIVFVVDASGSMAAEERMSATKGAILSLLLDAYQRRDRVGMVVFRKDHAELVLPPTNSVELAQRYLTVLPTGGRTPLAHGLALGFETIQDYMKRDKDAIPLLALISDGRANVPLNGGDPIVEAKTIAREISSAGIKSIAIDTERDYLTFGLVKQVCDEMKGKYLQLEELSANPIVSAVRNNLYQTNGAYA
jgi:magnesium chelatase subunit D